MAMETLYLSETLLAARLRGALRNAFAQKLRPERHKYDMGHLLLIAGSKGMTGAMVLAAKAAARSGCGLVTVAHPAGADVQLNIAVPSVMTRVMDWNAPLESIGTPARYTAIAMGPGLGRETATAEGVREILSQPALPPLALDADALWAVSPEGNGGNPFDLRTISTPLVLTPHMGEFKRLFAEELSTGLSVEGASARFAAAPERFLILKQEITRIYSQGQCVVSNRPNAGFASGGSGDVLLGLLGGLLAWMPSVEFACLAAVLVHSAAGELARQALGELAMNPNDVVEKIGESVRGLEGILRKENTAGQ